MEKMEVKKDLAKRYVEVCTWIWAKTMPNIPHEYIVRGQSLPERDFVDFVKIIREYGVEEYWKRYKNKYLYLDGYKYWTMGNPIDETTIINRQKVFSAYDEKLVRELRVLDDALELQNFFFEPIGEIMGFDPGSFGGNDGSQYEATASQDPVPESEKPTEKEIEKFKEKQEQVVERLSQEPTKYKDITCPHCGEIIRVKE